MSNKPQMVAGIIILISAAFFLFQGLIFIYGIFGGGSLNINAYYFPIENSGGSSLGSMSMFELLSTFVIYLIAPNLILGGGLLVASIFLIVGASGSRKE